MCSISPVTETGCCVLYFSSGRRAVTNQRSVDLLYIERLVTMELFSPIREDNSVLCEIRHPFSVAQDRAR